MSHLLHLDSSARRPPPVVLPRADRRFADTWRAAHPDGAYTYRDLAADPVPMIGGAWTEICDALLSAGITDPPRYGDVVSTPQQRATWAVVEPLLTELLAADVVLIGAPMYNFSVPAAREPERITSGEAALLAAGEVA